MSFISTKMRLHAILAPLLIFAINKKNLETMADGKLNVSILCMNSLITTCYSINIDNHWIRVYSGTTDTFTEERFDSVPDETTIEEDFDWTSDETTTEEYFDSVSDEPGSYNI